MATKGAMLFVPRGTSGDGDHETQHRYVLICDQNREMCKTIARIVNILGFQAVAATEGRTALRLAKRQLPDLILLAENMPAARAIDFLDAGLGSLLTRRVLLVDRRTAHRPRWLPTLSKPMEINDFKEQLSRLICDADSRQTNVSIH